MKQDINGNYTVHKGETVTIVITPSASLGAGQAVASRDGGAQPTLVFPVTNDVGQVHRVEVSYGFDNVQAGAEYRTVIDGDSNDNEGPFVRKVNTMSEVKPRPSRDYLFLVVN
jgi:hypothetical protein